MGVPSHNLTFIVLLFRTILVFCLADFAFGQGCSNIPLESKTGEKDYWVGSWEFYDSSEHTIGITATGTIEGQNDYQGATCEEVVIYKNASAISAFFWGNIIVKKAASGGGFCYGCVKVEQRTANVMEFKFSPCSRSNAADAKQSCEASASGSFYQMYRSSPKILNCRNTFEGNFWFTYEKQNNEGICDNSENLIQACQKPGSLFKDNEVFDMYFKRCPGNTASFEQQKQYQCLGTWKDPYKPHHVYSAILDRSMVLFKDKIRCLLTYDNQQLYFNRRRYTMSAVPSCNELKSDYDGDLRIITQPSITSQQSNAMAPSCMLPQNFSGTWFTSSQYDSKVDINTTHIHFNTQYSTFFYVETYFTCQQTRDTRYLMKQVTKGRCEVDYICFEFLPRHQNIIRFRMGKPYRVISDIVDETRAQEVFKTVCSWSSFTISRTENVNYLYQTFILYPPAPIECPIGGIYNFTQTGVEEFKYYTKIRGVTERPRVSYQCDLHEAEFKCCSGNPKIVWLDVERCASVDHVGRPLGEYDEPDNYLQCVGYWQENQKSYLVTYDTEDSVVPFRCWVYERLGWKDIRISRALRAACSPLQTPRSSSDKEGASLALELRENEREFDECPQKYLDGRDPYLKSTTVYVIGAASFLSQSTTFLLCVPLVISILF